MRRTTMRKVLILPILAAASACGGNAQGRPVGVAIDRLGGLLVADDVGKVIWRVSAKE